MAETIEHISDAEFEELLATAAELEGESLGEVAPGFLEELFRRAEAASRGTK